MKKYLMITALVLISTGSVWAQKITYYSTTISNPDKTIDFDFGFYVKTAQYTEPAGAQGYTTVRCGVLNMKTAKPLNWNNYKVHIYLKSGKLIRNYTPQATTGDFAAIYTVDSGATHIQEYCFSGKFTDADIDKIWLVMGDMEIFELHRQETDPVAKK